jgi:hypothetical protein
MSLLAWNGGDHRRVIRIDRLMRQLYGANQREDFGDACQPCLSLSWRLIAAISWGALLAKPTPTDPSQLSIEGTLPSLNVAAEWLNSRPLTPASLSGNVCWLISGAIPASIGEAHGRSCPQCSQMGGPQLEGCSFFLQIIVLIVMSLLYAA